MGSTTRKINKHSRFISLGVCTVALFVCACSESKPVKFKPQQTTNPEFVGQIVDEDAPQILSVSTFVGTTFVPEGDTFVELNFDDPEPEFELNTLEPELRWYDYRWAESRDRVLIADYPVIADDCLRGPGVPAPEGCVKRFDFDFDGDVDMADMAYFTEHAQNGGED